MGSAPECHVFLSDFSAPDQAGPDVTVTVNNGHFNTFFFDNWPTAFQQQHSLPSLAASTV
jgi:hypothetical protein